MKKKEILAQYDGLCLCEDYCENYVCADNAWEDFVQKVDTVLENKGHFFKDTARDIGWMRRSGYMYFKATNALEFLRAFSPDTDCHYVFTKHGNGFSVKLSHHDAPMGETHIIMPIAQSTYNKEAQ